MAHSWDIPPTVTIPEDRRHDDQIITHPAYGQIGASRVSGHAVLYGSDFVHNGFIHIRIHKSELHRGLSNDWHHEREQIVEVALSEAQWATFVSTLNMGSGTPCTITHIEGRPVPGITQPINRREQFQRETDDRLAHAVASLDALQAEIAALKISAKQQDALQSRVMIARQELTSNIGFVADQFGEHMEKTIEHAKIEVGAYLTGAVARAGLQALGATPLLELPGHDTSAEDQE
jgi:hypothetical protein